MSDKEKVWGEIISSYTKKEPDEDDPIKLLIEEKDRILKEKCPKDMPIGKWKEQQARRTEKIEKKIWDMIYKKRMIGMMR